LQAKINSLFHGPGGNLRPFFMQRFAGKAAKQPDQNQPPPVRPII